MALMTTTLGLRIDQTAVVTVEVTLAGRCLRTVDERRKGQRGPRAARLADNDDGLVSRLQRRSVTLPALGENIVDKSLAHVERLREARTVNPVAVPPHLEPGHLQRHLHQVHRPSTGKDKTKSTRLQHPEHLNPDGQDRNRLVPVPTHEGQTIRRVGHKDVDRLVRHPPEHHEAVANVKGVAHASPPLAQEGQNTWCPLSMAKNPMS